MNKIKQLLFLQDLHEDTLWKQTLPSFLVSQEAASCWLSVGKARQTSC